jgi:hypothetical protein
LRLLAADGFTARLPNTPDVKRLPSANPEGASVPVARLYDVRNDMVVVAEIEMGHVGERIPAGASVLATQVNDLLLCGRGYPAFWPYPLHRQEQRNFCACVRLSFSIEVTAFVTWREKRVMWCCIASRPMRADRVSSMSSDASQSPSA